MFRVITARGPPLGVRPRVRDSMKLAGLERVQWLWNSVASRG
jgi:hypothetical protein